jgi:ubiquinone/menaquinone biosynthesis C-methylase UbiE
MRLALRFLSLLLCLSLAASVAAGEQERPPWKDVEHWVGVFEDPARREWQKPITVLTFLGIQNGATVADLGAGTGYFTALLALQVGPAGKVYAVDVEPAMLEHLKARDDISQDRVIPIQAKANNPMLPDGEIDLVLCVNTWHHIKKRTRYLKRLESSLTPEGRVAIVDFRSGELPVGPPPDKKVARDRVIAEFRDAGWRYVAESVALPYQYLLIFLPPDKNQRLFAPDRGD